MAQILVATGTQIRFCVAASFSPASAATNQTRGTPTDVALTLANLANGAGRQSDKVYLGSTRARRWELKGCVDFTGETPTANGRIDYYWAPSGSGTQGTDNVAGNSGADAAAPGSPVPAGLTLVEFLRMCQYIGSLATSDDAAVQNGYVGVFEPTDCYGQLVVVNFGGDTFEQDDVEMHQVLNPLPDEIVP